MRSIFPTKELEKEDKRLAEIWFGSGMELDDVIENNASEEYKKFYKKRLAEHKMWREKGVIDN